MKLHVKLEMDLDEQLMREGLHTKTVQETAIVIRSLIMQGMDESISEIGAENASVTVEVAEDRKG